MLQQNSLHIRDDAFRLSIFVVSRSSACGAPMGPWSSAASSSWAGMEGDDVEVDQGAHYAAAALPPPPPPPLAAAASVERSALGGGGGSEGGDEEHFKGASGAATNASAEKHECVRCLFQSANFSMFANVYREKGFPFAKHTDRISRCRRRSARWRTTLCL